MFGNNQDDTNNQHSQDEQTTTDAPQDSGVPALPTMGGPAPSPFDDSQPSLGSENDEAPSEPVSEHASAPPTTIAPQGSGPVSSDLLSLKQRALQQLSPLVSHLDQTPEEKFRTTMMMIQASDDQSLLSDAFEAAQKIEDDKARAQALLDVINEINYFTQQHSS